jgi:hypothetical protein
MELKPNRKLFPDHLPFIHHGALVGAGSLDTPQWYAQRAEQAWLSCCYHSIGLCESCQWHMQSIFCSAKAHEAF